MTLGEKIKEARKQAGLSQEQLAEKMNVSRSAVAKWETNKGLPDIDNLRYLSKLLSVSVDHLIDDGEDFESLVMREPYNLADYGKGLKKTRKDRVIRKRFPEAEIHTLFGQKILKRAERVADDLIGWLTPLPFGLGEFFASLRDLDKEHYLVDDGDKQFIVVITDEFIEIRRMLKRITEKKFTLGEWKYSVQKFHEPKK
ncbi:MAG: helix-turn-helix domain-containing protein [Clostridia bacterium]|nr:helix-turn-helix domain-containing protein [Clostridia bacterium]